MKMMTRVTVVALCLMTSGAVLPAQQPAPGPGAEALQGGWNEVSAWIAKSADIVPADKYGYRPVATVRTFGQLVAHVADAYNWYCASATANGVEWADPVEKGPQDKATLVKALKAATDRCAAVYASPAAARPKPVLGNLGHASLHYGNMITYMRMLGLTPPSS
jgi:uncharacterized damage-inducible protein DinB